jgi:CheY-like chemotaxis protein
VTVETRVGHGTTFRVFLPADKPADDKRAATVAPMLLRGQDELILVVDDEAGVRDVAAAILTEHGYRVITCSDGVEAVGLFTERSAEIQLVVSDINMPNLGGPALALVLRRLRPDVRILAITGLGSRGSSNAPMADTFTATIQKPFTVEALLTAVHRVLHIDPSTGSPPDVWPQAT